MQEALQIRDEKVLDVTAASVAAGERLFIWYHIIPTPSLESGKGFRPERGCLEGLERAWENHRLRLIGQSRVLILTRISRHPHLLIAPATQSTQSPILLIFVTVISASRALFKSDDPLPVSRTTEDRCSEPTVQPPKTTESSPIG